MQNSFLNDRVKNDIDKQVAKVLRGLDNPEPPLKLDQVRALLELDKQYYSTTDDDPLHEWISRVRVAGKQILSRPGLILDAVRKFDLKACYLPDQKRILLDKDVPVPKHRWNETHECIHDILPWHKVSMLGDTQLTLSLDCHSKIEAEANYGAGRLLFLQQKFDIIELSSIPSIKETQRISKLFGNSFTSTLWRVVEAQTIPAVGIVSCHPHRPSSSFDPSNPLRYFIRSGAFRQRFSHVSDVALFEVLKGYCGYVTKGPLGNSEIAIQDDNGDSHLFAFESFHNTHEALTLGVYVRKIPFTS